jgi:hypothetical protein
MTTTLSLSEIEFIKRELATLLPDVKSSHRVEAMARGLGWNSNAAMRAELALGAAARKVDDSAFSAYLRDHGFGRPSAGVLTLVVKRCTDDKQSPVTMDLNQPFSVEDVRRLIGSVPDDRNWRLVITYAGVAYICDGEEVWRRVPPRLVDYGDKGVEIADPRLAEERVLTQKRDGELLKRKSDRIFIRFETFGHGNGYVGSEAAADDAYVQDIYQDLKKSWPRDEKSPTYIDR